MRTVLLVVFSSSLVACSHDTIRKEVAADGGDTSSSENAAAGPGSTSGSRLKARWLAADDGARHFQGWHDTERDADCAFQTAEDGKPRCLPFSASMNTSWYADASCTRPIAYTSKGCDAPATAALTERYCAGGGAPTRVFALGAPYKGASVYTKTSSGCTASPVQSFAENSDLYTVGAAIAPDAFVAARETTE